MSRRFDATRGGETRYAIYGHTHRPTKQRWDGNLIHLNSGTWTPVFEYESGHVRNDLTLTFVELNEKAGNWKAKLLRWEPMNRAASAVILMEPHPHTV
jgi:predicted phosphodiesterase